MRHPTLLIRNRAATTRCSALWAAIVWLPAVAAEATTHESTIDVGIGYEQLKLPADEKMGLMGASVLFPLGSQWWAGPAVYGAASGQRGGLFVGGAELQRRFALPWEWDLRAGVFAGGGGGAAAPVGGGLMLRAAATLTHDIGPLRGGLSWSHVRFPSGEISSSQLGLVLSWERPFRYFDAQDAGQPQPAERADRLGLSAPGRHGGRVSVARVRHSARRLGRRPRRMAAHRRAAFSPASRRPPPRRAARPDTWRFSATSAGAGRRCRPRCRSRLEARGALGLGGGGGMPTEGGADRQGCHRRQRRLGPRLAQRHRGRRGARSWLDAARAHRPGVVRDGPRAATRRTRQRHHHPQRVVGHVAAPTARAAQRRHDGLARHGRHQARSLRR